MFNFKNIFISKEEKERTEIEKMICSHYKDEKFNQEIWVYGEVVKYGNSGVIILDEEKLIQIPHRAIVWMLPNGLTRQKKEKMTQKAINEAVETHRLILVWRLDLQSDMNIIPYII